MSGGFQLWAHPWWVNLLLFAPVLSFVYWRHAGLELSWRRLLYLVAFGVAFGFVEAAVVVYLRTALAVASHGASPPAANYQQVLSSIALFPGQLLAVEICREAATMVMLGSVALLGAARAKERWACFLWTFAAWDITYYAGLRATLGWPSSLLDFDVLFLIPVPWASQVWFPLLVSALAMTAVAVSSLTTRLSQTKERSPLAIGADAATEALPDGGPGAGE